jgi:hypothetical protein
MAALAGLLLGAGAVTSQAAANTPKHEPSKYLQMVNRYASDHPNDFVGLDALVFAHTGQHLIVQVNGSGPLSAESAQREWSKARVARKIASGDYPTDAFDVALSRFPTDGDGIGFMGSWNWRDDFVGQGEPFDIANLQFDIPECATTTSYAAAAGKWDGTSTEAPTLRDANIVGHSPLWNVDARVSDFENSADSGYVMATVDLWDCAGDVRVGGAFAYEGNIGGQLTNISAGYGLLNISYAGNDRKLQKSSAPMYAKYVTTGTLYGDFAFCAFNGRKGSQDGSWSDWRCVKRGTAFELWVVH